MLRFTIPIPPRTKKNSQSIVYCGGKPRIIQSKAYKAYEKDAEPFIPYMDEPIRIPVNVRAVFWMPTRRRVDLVNLEEALCDVLVKYGVLEDDNHTIVRSMDGSRVEWDKENPRTEVTIEEAE